MTRSLLVLARIWAPAAFGAALFACTPQSAALLNGDANAAEVRYSGDIANASRVARQHCAAYERVARLRESGQDIAAFDCVRP